jgi:hypothetical protein
MAEVLQGSDFSWSRPGGPALKAAGHSFVLRYCPYVGDQGKGLTKTELEEYLSNGLAVGLVFESTAGRMFDGYQAGVYDAQLVQAALLQLGLPIDFPVFHACDVDTDPERVGYIDSYMAGVNAVRGIESTGVYGEYDVVAHCDINRLCTFFWQTYAWSNGKRYANRHFLQYENGVFINGQEIDRDEGYGYECLYTGEFEVNKLDWENMKLRVFAGSERDNPTPMSREEKLTIADDILAQAGSAQSVFDLAASADSIAVAGQKALAELNLGGNNALTGEDLAKIFSKMAENLRGQNV